MKVLKYTVLAFALNSCGVQSDSNLSVIPLAPEGRSYLEQESLLMSLKSDLLQKLTSQRISRGMINALVSEGYKITYLHYGRKSQDYSDGVPAMALAPLPDDINLDYFEHREHKNVITVHFTTVSSIVPPGEGEAAPVMALAPIPGDDYYEVIPVEIEFDRDINSRADLHGSSIRSIKQIAIVGPAPA